MSKINNYCWKIAFLIGFGLMALAFLFPWLAVRNRLDSNQPYRETFMPLKEKETQKQSFVANHDFVNIIILYFKNPGLANQEEFNFKLKGEDGQVLVEKEFSGFNIGDPGEIRFQFEPLIGTKGKKLSFELMAQSSAESLISIGTDSERGLSYSVYYRTTNKKMALVELFSGFFKRLLEDKFFLVIWLLLIFRILRLAFLKTG